MQEEDKAIMRDDIIEKYKDNESLNEKRWLTMWVKLTSILQAEQSW